MLQLMQKLKNLGSGFLKNKILIENFSFLTILQAANLVLFLITVPYLFRVLGKDHYGLVIFAQTIVCYFSIFVNFGFNLTATRDISMNRDNRSKVSEIVSSVLVIKFLFFILSLILMCLLTMLVNNFREYRTLYLLSMMACLSEAIFPLWYFQGLEKMKYITFINVSTRVLSTALVFVFIRESSDYFKYPLIIGTGTISGALIALFIVFRKQSVMFRFSPLVTLKSYLNENVLYFLANVSTQVYVNANRIIVGIFLGMTQVAYYDVAEKVINIIKVPFSVLSQAFFPKFAKERNISFLKKVMYGTVLFTFLVVIALFLFSFPVMNFLTGSASVVSVKILRILSLSLLPISFSIFYGDIIMINFGMKNEYARMRFFGLLIYLALVAALIVFRFIGVFQLGITIIVVELFISVYSYFLCRRLNLS
jgi:O-antigen/teichoic acid export membrane protein